VAGFSISTGSLPNLAVVTIFPSYGPKWLRFAPILPRVGEPFFVNVVVINSGDAAALNFDLQVRILWGLNESVSNVGDRFDRLARGFSYFYYGPYTVPSLSNVTITVTVNSNRTVLESDYGDNSLTSTFAVGELFPSTKILPKDRVLWEQSEVPTFRNMKYEFDNRLHVVMSKDGDVVAFLTDSAHVSLFKNGSRVYEAQLSPVDSPKIGLSLSGRYFALGTYDDVRVFDVNKLLSGNSDAAAIFRVTKEELRTVLFSQVAVSDAAMLAIEGAVTCCTDSVPAGLNRLSVVVVIDTASKRVLWRKDFAVEFPPLGHDAYTSLIHALSFDESSRLLVGLWGDIFPGLHELNPWLYLFDSSGKLVWKREFNSPIAEDGAFISANGLAVVAAMDTEDGRVYYINRDTNFTYTKLVGDNIWPGHSLWSLP